MPLNLLPLVGAVDVTGEPFDSTGVLLGCSPERIRIVQLLVWTTTWQDTRPRCYVNGVQVVYEYDGGLLSNKHKHGPGKDEGPGAGLVDDLLGRANLTGLVLGCIEAKFCKKICV